MNQVKLFEIPIYSMKEKSFNKKWDNFKQKTLDEFITSGWNEIEAKISIERLYYPHTIWRYNQIVGYIIISASEFDVWFDLHKTLDKKLYIKSNRKHFIENLNILGHHFRVEKDENNEKIKDNIIEWLSLLCKEEILKRYYIDKNIFNKQIKYMDIRQAINEICNIEE